MRHLVGSETLGLEIAIMLAIIVIAIITVAGMVPPAIDDLTRLTEALTP